MGRKVCIDEIVKSVLLQREKSVHWYWQYAKLATDCLRELRMDTLGIVCQKKAVVSEDGLIALPCSAIIVLSIRPHPQPLSTSGEGGPPRNKGCSLKWEEAGCSSVRVIGVAAGEKVVMEYVSDGSDSDAATKAPAAAQSAIESYIIWKAGINRDNKDSAEGRIFYNEYRILRGRMNNVTIQEFNNSLMKN
jgi:hypothetical protein